MLPSPGLYPAAILLVEIENGSIAHLLDAVNDAGSGSLFFDLLANESPQEILSSLVVLGRSDVHQFVYPTRHLALMIVYLLKHFERVPHWVGTASICPKRPFRHV